MLYEVITDGGPRDITRNCNNGYLIDPLDKPDIEKALLKILSDTQEWRALSRNGRNNFV